MKTDESKIRPDLDLIVWAFLKKDSEDMGPDSPLHYVDPKDENKTLCGEEIPLGKADEFGIWGDTFCDKCHEKAGELPSQK